jgi:hypothetical protein
MASDIEVSAESHLRRKTLHDVDARAHLGKSCPHWRRVVPWLTSSARTHG